jgi:hypothetical protein
VKNSYLYPYGYPALHEALSLNIVILLGRTGLGLAIVAEEMGIN